MDNNNTYTYTFEPVPENGALVPSSEKAKKKKKGWTAGRIIALALVCALLGGAFGAGGALLGNKLLGSPEGSGKPAGTTVYEGTRDPAVVSTAQVNTGKLMTEAEVYAANVNSTVGITVGITTNYWGYQTTTPASGSGFILTSDGYIVTNYHVIEKASTVSVSLYNGESYDAVVVGGDESSDLAVLKIEAKGLTPVVLGSSDSLRVGDKVVAIGNPLGELTFSLTHGCVSALDRTVTFSGGLSMELIQTDCAINAGNSGGALFNLYGEVIGITNAKYSGNGSSTEASIDNIGFAIPIDHVRAIIESLIETGVVKKPYIGVQVTDVNSQALAYGLPNGAAVAAVVEGSPAESAGLRENDIITEVNGQTVTGSQGLVDLIGQAKVGETYTLTVYRQGKTLTMEVTVGEQVTSSLPTQNQEDEQNSSRGGQSFPWGWGSRG